MEVEILRTENSLRDLTNTRDLIDSAGRCSYFLYIVWLNLMTKA
jgi:hypothetical protein